MRAILDSVVMSSSKQIPDEVFMLPQYSGNVEELPKKYHNRDIDIPKMSVVDFIKQGTQFHLKDGNNIIHLPNGEDRHVDADTMKFIKATIALSVSDIEEVSHAATEALYEYFNIENDLADCEKTKLHDAVKDEILEYLIPMAKKG